MRVVVTGGAGFVGGNLAVALAERDLQVVAFDNLRRSGSALNVPRLETAGVRFIRGDVRSPEDLEDLGEFDALIECSAEPSVLGAAADTSYAFHTNVSGAFNCLEAARRRSAFFVFISTSRVYPIRLLSELRYDEAGERFELSEQQTQPGASSRGIAEDFPLDGARTLYGATKLAAELLIAEYIEAFELRAVINRCGVLSGPWQMGRVDQGVFSWWLLCHLFGHSLSYIGYGGEGKQVRDLLHIDDLVDLIADQIMRPDTWAGQTLNVGGGRNCSLSLAETTELCREITGSDVDISSVSETREGDVPIYISDCSRLHSMTSWRPQKSPRDILLDVYEWARIHDAELRATLFS